MYLNSDIHLRLLQAGFVIHLSLVFCLIPPVFEVEYFLIVYYKFF